MPDPSDSLHAGGLTRYAARILLFDRTGRVLLFLDEFPDLPGQAKWITPGGGADPGETPHETAVRELYEETGLVADGLGELVHSLRFPVNRPAVRHTTSHWDFFVHVVDEPFEPSREHWTEEELAQVLGHRWWTLQELVAEQVPFAPAGLLGLVARYAPGSPERLVAEVAAQPAIDVPSFGNDDAVELGELATELSRTARANLSVRVVLRGDVAYQARLGTTGPDNDPWLDGKARAVAMTGEPSILSRLRAEAAGQVFEDGDRPGIGDVRGHGGSVPIRVRGELVGTLTTSGEPDRLDHAVAAEAVRRFLAARGLA
ncbi:MAG: heme-binding protein [Microbacteriaceae bacterium]|nr:heme-binding protein [Microbacteriaceae bacterium]